MSSYILFYSLSLTHLIFHLFISHSNSRSPLHLPLSSSSHLFISLTIKNGNRNKFFPFSKFSFTPSSIHKRKWKLISSIFQLPIYTPSIPKLQILIYSIINPQTEMEINFFHFSTFHLHPFNTQMEMGIKFSYLPISFLSLSA